MKKNLLFIVISAILSLLILWPIRQIGAWYPMHDSTHSARVVLMTLPIISGQIPPVWAETINGGFGYPLFQFYAPLFHTVSTLLSFPIFPITSAIKVALFMSIFVGILGVMMFARRWGRISGIVAGVAFAMAPYAAVNIYVRGAFSEYLCIALLPWVFLLTEKISSVKKMIIASIILSLFVLSHNLIPILALPMILIWMIYNNRSSLKLMSGAIALSILLSSWFVLPLLFERGFTQADQIARTTNYSLHFVEPWQLWNSTWGYGGSGLGVEDGMSFKLGKVQIVLGLIGIAFAYLQNKRSLRLLSLFALIAVFLAIPFSKFIWDSSAILQIVQFPWRTLGIITVILAIFTGFTVSRIPTKMLRIATGVILVGVLIFLNYKYFAPQTVMNSPLDKTEIGEDEIPDIASVVPEYAPIWWHREKLNTDEKFQFMSPDSVTINEDSTELQGRQDWGYKLDLIASESASISFGAAYYPTWEGRIDGKKVEVKPDDIGLASLQVPAGSHTVTLIQKHTLLESIASFISIFTLIIMVKLYVKK